MLNLYEGVFTYNFNKINITRDGNDGGEAPVVDTAFWNTFTGKYSYYSRTVDGQFGIPIGRHQGPLLNFLLAIPHPLSYGDTDYSFHNSETPGPLVTVSGGVVTDFSLNSEIGPVGLSFDFGTFKVGKTAGDGWLYDAEGEIRFKKPKLSKKKKPIGPQNVEIIGT